MAADGASSPSAPSVASIKGKEFVAFPENFNDFVVEPPTQLKLSNEPGSTSKLMLSNRGKIPVLYKIKCTNNKRIGILDCAGVLEAGKDTTVDIKRKKLDAEQEDSICIVYLLLGETGGDNACIQWRRATEQQHPTKNFVIKIIAP